LAIKRPFLGASAIEKFTLNFTKNAILDKIYQEISAKFKHKKAACSLHTPQRIFVICPSHNEPMRDYIKFW